jgi:16S rRNA (uracil1498-N3)-methyltransferase
MGMVGGSVLLHSVVKYMNWAMENFYSAGMPMLHMRLHRFFITDKVKDKKEIYVENEELLHQLRNVFRFAPGSKVIINDDSGFDHFCTITGFTGVGVTFDVNESRENNNVPRREVYLFASIVKKDTFEWVLEKGTELGVSRIIPVLADRSEKKSINFERAKKIVHEAAEQSGRATLPRLYELMPLDDALAQYDMPSLMWHPEGQKYTREDFGDGILCVYIGPEGGWTEREIGLFNAKKIPILSLGAPILRAETASIAILSLLLL